VPGSLRGTLAATPLPAPLPHDVNTAALPVPIAPNAPAIAVLFKKDLLLMLSFFMMIVFKKNELIDYYFV
jgi:hypothetical protein